MLIGVYHRRTGCRVGSISADALGDGESIPLGTVDLLRHPREKRVMDAIRALATDRVEAHIVVRVEVAWVDGPRVLVDHAAALHGVPDYVHDS